MMQRLLVALLPVLFVTCISPYNPDIDLDGPKLVVDGTITDQHGPHQVTLSFSSAYNNDRTIPVKYITDAAVSIKDNEGVDIKLTHTEYGIYQTPAATTGDVGKSYSLHIKLADGRQYKSTQQELLYTPPIDTVFGTYEEFTGIGLRGEFTLYLETTDPTTTINYYRWSWSHYEFKPYCHLVPNNYLGTTDVIDCCESCWAIERCYGCINILSDQFVNGRKIANVPITKIPYDSRDPYFIIVKQTSLTEDAYHFWKTISEQISSSGGIFDKPPITIQGNVANIHDDQEQVLGMFSASAVQTRSLHFQRNKVGKPPFGQDIIYRKVVSVPCIRCSVGPTRTTQKPDGW